jgi:uncharacterized protein (TIGR03435 family)
MISAISSFIAPVANHLWQSTLFAAAAGLLTLVLRRNPARARSWIWVAASCKFLVPFSALIVLGGQVSWRTAPRTAQSVTLALDQVSQPFAAAAVSSAPVAAPAARDLLPLVLGILWALGSIGIAGSWWVRWRRVRAAVRAGTPAPLGIPVQALTSRTSLEPGVFGIFRPVLLLPEGIFERLTPEQFRAVLAHELCHVRHRDNLAAAMQMFVETVFWFHPLVWWIGTRMVEERERACDEEVMRLGNEPRVYARSLLTVCELYLESRIACVAGVSGANLSRRIRAILTHRGTERVSIGKKIVLAAAGAAALAAPIAMGIVSAPSMRAQSTPASAPAGRALKFEVASIKPSLETRVISVRPLPGRLTANAPLRVLMQYAYGVQPFQIVGGPDWIGPAFYSIEAKAAGNAGRAQAFAMLQSLLEDRFQLKIHRETRELPIYSLVAAKSGLRLPAPKDGGCANPSPDTTEWAGGRIEPPAQGPPSVARCGSVMVTLQPSGARMQGGKIGMPDLVRQLSMVLGRTVVDRTGFTGMFDLQLDFLPDEVTEALPPPPPDAGAAARAGSSILTAVQEQLGLRLESAKGPVEVLVIDDVEKPAAN